MPNKQKILGLAGVAICAIVGLFMFFSTAAQAADTCSVTKSANVRSGPGTSYSVVGGHKAGDVVAVEGKNTDGSWIRIGTDRWMAAFLLDCSGNSGQNSGSNGTSGIKAPAEGIRISGVRATVPMSEVDFAKGGFSAKWPALGHIFAEPGKLMVGPQFPQDKIDASGGAIQRIDPGNQYRLNSMDGQLIGCQEGAFVFIAVQHAHIEMRDFVIDFRVPDGDNAHVAIRCLNSDQKRGSDAGNDIMVTQYKPNSGLVTHFPGNPHGGFISADGQSQALQISSTTNSSGAEGANWTWIIGFDANTGAYTVAKWDGSNMIIVATNWYVAG